MDQHTYPGQAAPAESFPTDPSGLPEATRPELLAVADGGDLHATCEAVQEELVRVDRDIADRYFAGAVGTMVAV